MAQQNENCNTQMTRLTPRHFFMWIISSWFGTSAGFLCHNNATEWGPRLKSRQFAKKNFFINSNSSLISCTEFLDARHVHVYFCQVGEGEGPKVHVLEEDRSRRGVFQEDTDKRKRLDEDIGRRRRLEEDVGGRRRSVKEDRRPTPPRVLPDGSRIGIITLRHWSERQSTTEPFLYHKNNRI